MKEKTIDLALLYSGLILVFFGLIVPFVWSYAENLLAKLSDLQRSKSHSYSYYKKEVRKIKNFYFSTDYIVYSASIYSVFSFSVALMIMFSYALSAIFIKWALYILFILNAAVQIGLALDILKRRLKEWLNMYILFIVFFNILFTCWYFIDICKYRRFDKLLIGMFGFMIVYLVLLLIPPWKERPVTNLYKLRGLISD